MLLEVFFQYFAHKIMIHEYSQRLEKNNKATKVVQLNNFFQDAKLLKTLIEHFAD